MIILTRKVFCFVKQDSVDREEAIRFTTKGGLEIEDAPEWIKNDPLYAWGLEDGDIVEVNGDIVEVNGKTPKAEAEAVAKAKQSKAEDKRE